jgi:hypothetical protein
MGRKGLITAAAELELEVVSGGSVNREVQYVSWFSHSVYKMHLGLSVCDRSGI